MSHCRAVHFKVVGAFRPDEGSLVFQPPLGFVASEMTNTDECQRNLEGMVCMPVGATFSAPDPKASTLPEVDVASRIGSAKGCLVARITGT